MWRLLSAMPPVVDLSELWQPLPAAEWDADAARHLLRRAGWTARPADVERATNDGLVATLDRLFPAEPPLFSEPRFVAKVNEDSRETVRQLAALPEPERRKLRHDLDERAQDALRLMTLRWLQFAVKPDHAAVAKWGLFLGDVYVVASEKVNNPHSLWLHGDIIARHAFGPAPSLTKAVSRSPAMIRYLDLAENRRGAPNENFARELLELFVLGEGHYTERDIKEAARTFTGYRLQYGEFAFIPQQHDFDAKTVFGETGPFSGDDVIDLAYRRPAAGTFLPHEMVKFYLSDTPLAPEILAPLGQWWCDRGYDLGALVRRFFGSRIFFAPEHRGNFIKSPVQYYLGLLQSLELDVTPIPRFLVYPLRAMGQWLYNPPNVRGWVGGRNWINSGTLAARQLLVEKLFAPLHEAELNADEINALRVSRKQGESRFSVDDARFAVLGDLPAGEAAAYLAGEFLASTPPAAYLAALHRFLAEAAHSPAERRAHLRRRAAIALLQSPEYQLC